MARWRIECQTCKHAGQCFDGYHIVFSCNKDECQYEPYENTATAQTNYIDWVHKDTETTSQPYIPTKQEWTSTNDIYPSTKQDYLELIQALCVDYDGYRTVKDLKSLIDEIKGLASEGMRAKQ